MKENKKEKEKKTSQTAVIQITDKIKLDFYGKECLQLMDTEKRLFYWFDYDKEIEQKINVNLKLEISFEKDKIILDNTNFYKEYYKILDLKIV